MSKRPRVVITDFVTGPLETERGILGDVADVVGRFAPDEDKIAGGSVDARALML